MSVGKRTLLFSLELGVLGVQGSPRMLWVVEGNWNMPQRGSLEAKQWGALNLAAHPGPRTDLFKYINSQAPPQAYGPVSEGGVEISLLTFSQVESTWSHYGLKMNVPYFRTIKSSIFLSVFLPPFVIPPAQSIACFTF